MFYAFSTHWDLTGITEQESGCIPSHQYTSGVVTFLLGIHICTVPCMILPSVVDFLLFPAYRCITACLPSSYFFCSLLSSIELMALTGHWFRVEIHQTILKNPMISAEAVISYLGLRETHGC